MRFEFYKQLMRETRNDFLVNYKSNLKLLEGNNKKLHKFKNCFVNRFNTNQTVASLKIKFTNFDNLLIAMNLEGVPITNNPLFTDINDVEQWNDFWGTSGSNTIFDAVEVDGDNFEVTLTGNIDAVTYLGYTTFDVKMVGLEISGFVNLEQFYGDKNDITYITIDVPNAINYLAFNNTALDDNGLKAILAVMSTTEVANGSIDFAGFQTFTPDSEGLAYKASLEGKGWSVSY